MIKIGLLGLPNAGKSTLFNALTVQDALVASYPFSTVTTNRAIVDIVDERFERLGERIGAKNYKYSQIELWDIAGLIEGASKGSGLGNEFLGQLKECDALLHVIRITSNDSVINSENVVIKELSLFDHSLLKKPYEKNKHLARIYPNVPGYIKRDAVITAAYRETISGTLLDTSMMQPDEIDILKEVGLVSIKPIIKMMNQNTGLLEVDEHNGAVKMNAAELCGLRALNQQELKELGIDAKIIGYRLSVLYDMIMDVLLMKRFYTIGHLGIGQWVAPFVSNAQECSRRIHNELDIDTVKVATYKDIYNFGGWEASRKAGRVKVYSAKRYVPSDGDILWFDE